MAQIVRFNEIGGPEVLRLEECELAQPGPSEVRIRVQAIGLNRAEVLFRQGLYLEAPELPGARIGYEAAGIVDAVGSEVTDFKIGDYVSTIPGFSQSKHGVYGEQAIVPARFVAHMPESISPSESASIWMAYLTAYGALVELGQMSAGQYVLVTAASSSVGCAAIQIIRDAGAIAIATTRTAEKKQALLDIGANHVIVTDDQLICEHVDTITSGHGADIIFDAIAGPIMGDLARACAFEGTIFVYGALSLKPTPFPLRATLKKGVGVRGYTMFQITKDNERLARGKDYVSSRLQSGTFKPIVAREFDFADLASAHEYMESNQHLGKIVVTVSQ